MQTEWIWEAKANQAILTEKRSQKVWLKQDLLNRKHVYALLQRSRDIFFSLLAIIVLSPLMLLTALLIVLDDPHGALLRLKASGATAAAVASEHDKESYS